jgi:hypothetical protein
MQIGAPVKQAMLTRLRTHKECISIHGDDMPEIRNGRGRKERFLCFEKQTNSQIKFESRRKNSIQSNMKQVQLLGSDTNTTFNSNKLFPYEKDKIGGSNCAKNSGGEDACA